MTIIQAVGFQMDEIINLTIFLTGSNKSANRLLLIRFDTDGNASEQGGISPVVSVPESTTVL